MREIILRRGEEEPGQPRAMQLVLHLPKVDPPRKTALLEAAAIACVHLCCFPPSDAAAAQLDAWYDRKIRKIARRARGKQWLDVQSLEGYTASVNGAQARAFVPGLIAEAPRPIARLQIQGTELPEDNGASSSMGSNPPVILAVNAALEMTLGKAAAQVAHASMLYAAAHPDPAWAAAGFPLAVQQVDADTFVELCARPDAVVVRDAGFTEVAPGSATVVAIPNV